jgi:HSP20 family molecular chaperone IbpA
MSNGMLFAMLLTMALGGVANLYAKDTPNPAGTDPWAREQEWAAQARKTLDLGLPIPTDQFDKLFNDEFFNRKFDPFAEINDAEKRLAPLFKEEQRALMGQSFRDWFESRMQLFSLNPQIASTKDKVIDSFTVPGGQGSACRVDVNKSRIRISCEQQVSNEKKDVKSGTYEKSAAMQRIDKVMPIPPGVNPNSAKTERDGDVMKVIFDKK